MVTIADAPTMSLAQYLRSECLWQGEIVRLRPLDAALVAVLILRRGKLTTLDQFVEALWPYPDEEPNNPKGAIGVLVCRINKKMPGSIRNRWGQGWELGAR